MACRPLSLLTRSRVVLALTAVFFCATLLGSYRHTLVILETKDVDAIFLQPPRNVSYSKLIEDEAADLRGRQSTLGASSAVAVDDVQKSSVESLRTVKFYILDLPEATSQLVEKFGPEMSDYYNSALNEDAGEVWIHRCFEQHPDRTLNESEADIVLIPGYLRYNHLRRRSKGDSTSPVPYSREELTRMVVDRINSPSKPHVLLTPAISPQLSVNMGILAMTEALKHVNLYSVGFERNPAWQRVSADRIIPVPYVVKPDLPRETIQSKLSVQRTRNFVFYAGDIRPRSEKWAGCDRGMVAPLRERTDMDVRIVNKKNRLSQTEYNHRMDSSEFCLLVCGDTPTSRSLASSMVAGCIPLRIGSRLRGQCERPCHRGFGWTITGLSHLPYEHLIDWTLFPEVDEQAFVNDPNAVLDAALASISDEQRQQMRDVMNTSQLAFTYGWGDPVTSTEFGDAVPWIWESIQRHLGLPATAAIATMT